MNIWLPWGYVTLLNEATLRAGTFYIHGGSRQWDNEQPSNTTLGSAGIYGPLVLSDMT